MKDYDPTAIDKVVIDRWKLSHIAGSFCTCKSEGTCDACRMRNAIIERSQKVGGDVRGQVMVAGFDANEQIHRLTVECSKEELANLKLNPVYSNCVVVLLKGA